MMQWVSNTRWKLFYSLLMNWSCRILHRILFLKFTITQNDFLRFCSIVFVFNVGHEKWKCITNYFYIMTKKNFQKTFFRKLFSWSWRILIGEKEKWNWRNIFRASQIFFRLNNIAHKLKMFFVDSIAIHIFVCIIAQLKSFGVM